MTQLERLQTTGIRRLGKKNHFRYVYADGSKVRRDDLARIDSLRIPPGWHDVAINRAAGGMLQAVGKDEAGRWQYIYHEQHVRKAQQKKFKRLLRFVEAMPRMRRTVRQNLRKHDLGRERVMSCVLRILSTCFMRAGSQVYANENGSYGLATLRPKHVRVHGDFIEFKFRGKRQVLQERELKDRSVARVVRRLLEQRVPAQVFKFQNGDGSFVPVRRRNINEYISEIMGARFTSKDFRTWAGTLICANALARLGADLKESTAAARKRAIVAAIKETAEILGNTPAVCRSSYISPEILDKFARGEAVDQYFPTLEDLVNHRGTRLHKAEKALLRMLKRST
jgi:DNA topoisomerase-1